MIDFISFLIFVVAQMLTKQSVNYGKDLSLLYNCLEYGASGSLYISYYGDSSKHMFSITCSYCEFRVLHYTHDYSESWVELEEWLVKNNYL